MSDEENTEDAQYIDMDEAERNLKVQETLPSIKTNHNLMISSDTYKDYSMEEIKFLMESGLLPKELTVEKAFFLKEYSIRTLGVDPLFGMTNIHIIKGKLSISPYLVAALAKARGIDYNLIVDCERDEMYGVICTIELWDKKEIKSGHYVKKQLTFSLKEATQMGLTSKDNWQRMPKIMMRLRTLGLALRYYYPEVLANLYFRDEIE